MLRNILFILIMVIAMPVLAEQSLSPADIEKIPFYEGLSTTTNTENLYNDIDLNATVENAHATDPHKKKAGLPQFDTTTFTSQLFWLFITFVILYVFFARKTLPTISSIIENRKATVKGDLKSADEISIKVDKTRNEYEAAMAGAYEDARQATQDAEAKSREHAEVQANLFKEKSKTAVQEIEKKASAAKDKIKQDLELIAVDLASDIIKNLSDLNISENDIKDAISLQLANKSSPMTKKAA